MRHKKWNHVMDYLHSIAEHLGPTIVDKRVGKVWDVGQAVCAEAYGPEWMNNKTFIEWNNKDDDEPPEPHFYGCAKAMADGEVPKWVEI